MSCWTIGLKACGIPGAGVWQEHWALLFRNAREVVLALDADSSGDKGRRRVLRSLSRFGIEARFAEIPSGKDINDLLVSGGAKAVREALG